jgi:Domain of unknown function (DUF4160)
MPTALREGPYGLFFFSNEGDEPPHVHVRAGGSVAKFWLEPVRFERNRRFAAHELTQVQSMVAEHRTELLGAWNDYFGSR